MNISFSKMQALGNDFVVIDATQQPFSLTCEQIQHMADRRLGIGFDQMLVLERASHPDVDFLYRIFNADGGEVDQCGNGARCVARFIEANQLSHHNKLVLQTRRGDHLELVVEANNNVSVKIEEPKFHPNDIPFIADQEAPTYELKLADQVVAIGVANVGNPHAIIQVEDVDKAPFEQLGMLITKHSRFPEGVNVDFMQIIDSKHINLRVFERGTGPTRACGSAACAAMAWGRKNALLSEQVRVSQPGGELTIYWKGLGSMLTMSGPGEFVFQGEWPLST